MGAVMHCYNTLAQLGGLDEIPVLEKFGKQFSGPLFPGGIPTSNYQNTWARYVGARLKFGKNHKGKNTHQDWCLAIPALTAKIAAGIGIPDHRQKVQSGCILFNIKQQGYHVSGAQWDEINNSYAKVKELRKQNGSQPLPEIGGPKSTAEKEKEKLLPLAVTVQALFTGRSGKTLPLARVSLFAVFQRCVRVVSTLSQKAHPEAHGRKEDHCVCFAAEILMAADRLVKGRRYGKPEAWKKHERELVDDTKDAIMAAFGNVKEAELLWDV